MKKLIILIAFMLGAVFVYPQATPFNGVRVANSTAPFNINLSKGTQVWDIGAQKLFQCTAATAAALTLTTGAANFIQIGGAGLGGTVTSVATNTGSGITGGTITTTGTLAIDTTIIQTKALTTSQLTLKNTKADTANDVRVWKLDNPGDILVADGNNTYVAVAGNGTATKKFLSETSGTGSFVIISASDVGAQAAFTSDVVDYEPAADSLTTCHIALNGTPIGKIQVLVNGFPLMLTTHFIIQTSPDRVRIANVPIYAYDKIEIQYKY